jgi:hypothetical protein
MPHPSVPAVPRRRNLPKGVKMATATATSVLDRSLTQRMDALAVANDVRVRRARLKRDVKARRVDARAIVLEPPAYAMTMKLWDLLLAVPKLGRGKVNRMFVRLHVSPSKTLGGLSERQRAEIADAL